VSKRHNTTLGVRKLSPNRSRKEKPLDYEKLAAFFNQYAPDRNITKAFNQHEQNQKDKKGVAEGIMDTVKQAFNDNVAAWPMGTSDEQFIKSWADDIRDRTGRDIPAEKLARLYQDYTRRSPDVMQSHGTTNEESGVAEARPDVMRHKGDKTVRVVKKGGKPIGEIGTDAEASPGNGQYYVKLYDGSYDAVGFDSAEEALAELKAAIKQGVAEGRESDQKILRLYTGGKSPETIATQLNIDVDTVKDYIKNRMPQSDQDDRSRGYSSVRTVSQGMNEQGVTEGIDPVEQLRADILRFAR
jgi:hypothetical protein